MFLIEPLIFGRLKHKSIRESCLQMLSFQQVNESGNKFFTTFQNGFHRRLPYKSIQENCLQMASLLQVIRVLPRR